MRLKFKRIITMTVQNITLVDEVFQIEVSDGLVHPLGVVKMKLVSSYGYYWGMSFQKIVYVKSLK